MNFRRIGTTGIQRLALLVALMASVFPFYWMLRTSVAHRSSIFFRGIDFFPDTVDLSGYARAWTEGGLGRAMLNGLIVVGGILILQLLTCIPAAYAFAKLEFRGRHVLYLIVLSGLLIPTQSTAVPVFIELNLVGIVDSYVALIIPFATTAFGIFLLRQHMVSIPQTLIEAGRMDGLSRLAILVRIVVPLSLPAIAAFSVVSVFVHWNDYLWPLLITRDANLRTPALGLAVFQQVEGGLDYGALCAGAAIVMAPILLLFGMAQKRFVQGLAGGEIVG